jgi:hypothetical protein
MEKSVQGRVDELEKQHAALLGERSTLTQDLQDQKTLSDDDLQAAMEFRENVIAGIQAPTFEDKRQVLELLKVEVIVKDRKARISCRIPTEFDQRSDRSIESHISTSRCKTNVHYQRD